MWQNKWCCLQPSGRKYRYYCLKLIWKAIKYLLRGCLHEISSRAKWNISISVFGQFLITVYRLQPEMRLIAGDISLRSLWHKRNFISGDKISCKHYLKWNHMKRSICTCVNKNDWLLLNGPFISDHPRDEIHFIFPAMKSNVNRISFVVGWNFISGLMWTPSKFWIKRFDDPLI